MSTTPTPTSTPAQRGWLRRKTAAIAIGAGLALGALLGIAAGDEDEGYLVRAIFDNGSFVIPGEDVKIAGVVVGAIHDVDLTEDNKAAVVLRIDDPAFVPFRRDAHCQIRLQSLIGEQFIECQPTKPRGDAEEPPRALAEIADGRGEGQHLLPLANNTTPVPVDLINNISRMPQQEGLRLLISELGAGLAGNGEELRAALRRASPALQQTDRVFKILADQNRLLGRLIDESDQVLAAWVQRREQTAGFIDHAGATAVAAAERGDDIERNFERLPAFLREFKPTADTLSALADQMTPALNTLGGEAQAINASIERFGPFTSAATPALVSLGDFADEASELFPAFRPLVGDLARLSRPLRPAVDDTAALLASIDRTGGIEELMKLIYFYTGTTNGVDELGHYVRTTLSVCSGDRKTTSTGCESSLSRFGDPARGADAGAASAQDARTSPLEEATVRRDAAAAGYDLDSAEGEALLDYLLGPDSEASR